MGNYLIQIIKDNVRIPENGKISAYNKGDWVEVSRQTATLLIAEEKGKSHDDISLLDTDGFGVVLPDTSHSVETFFKAVDVSYGAKENKLPFKRNLFLDKGYSFKDKKSIGIIQNPAQFAQFAELLKTWDVVLILNDYDSTILDSNRELEATESLTYDLRMPYYQTCAIGIQDTKDGRAFYKAWQAEQQNGKMHALVRALFLTIPTHMFLGQEWGKQ